MKRLRKTWRIATLNREAQEFHVRVSGTGEIPATLCLDRNYAETIQFFHDLRVRSMLRGRGVLRSPARPSRIGWIRHFRDFTPLRYISAGAAMMLAAEYDRVFRLSGVPPATIDIHAWDEEVKSTLSHLGFFKLLGLHLPPVPSPRGNVIQEMVSGSNANMTPINEAIVNLFVQVGGHLGLRVQLASAVTDAVENVRSHAYPTDWFDPRRHAPFWWFTGAADQASKRVTLALYDQGVTIPSALPRKWDLQMLTSLFRNRFSSSFDPLDRSRDGEAIDIAMQLGETSTNLTYRGRGLPKILDIIRSCPEGRLRIVSRCGECVFHADGTKQIATHPVPLLGTYVELEASLTAAA